MGYMTVVTILNDGWANIKTHTEQFIKNIEDGMNGYREDWSRKSQRSINSYPVGNFVNPMEVSQSFHADNSQIFFVGQNCTTVLTDWRTAEKKDIEFQLKRIKEAKAMLNISEKNLREKLKEMEKYKPGMTLVCFKDYIELQKGESRRLCLEGKRYEILSIYNESYVILTPEEEKNYNVGIHILELKKCFKICERK